MKGFCTLLLMCVACLGVLAQPAPQYSTSSKKAIKLYQEAIEMRNARNFDRCISNLEEAVKIDPAFAEAYLQLGVSYRSINSRDKSNNAFVKAAELQPDNKSFAEAYYMIANIRILEGKYEMAQNFATKFVAFANDAKASRQISECKKILRTCEFALNGIQQPVPFNPQRLADGVNMFKQQYFPVLTADMSTMYFTAIAKQDEDVYECSWDGREWSKPKPVVEINTSANEGTCTISADGKTLIFTVCEGDKDRFVMGSCDLFISRKQGDVWLKPVNMGTLINSRAHETQPALSADGRTLYFTSDRPGGFGAHDIWVSKADEKGRWSAPINLGSVINTPGDDISPFIHVNGESLYFSSNGHLGFGGYDLYVSQLSAKDKTWSSPANLGYPINDYQDQVALFITSDGRKAYYTVEENQKGKAGLVNFLASFDIPEQLQAKQKKTKYVKGTVSDAKTKSPLGAAVSLTDINTREVISQVNADSLNGQYLIVLPEGSEYALYVSRDKYLFKSLSFNLADDKEENSLVLDIALDPIIAGTTVQLNNIFFASGAYALEDKSETELQKLIGFLRDNPKLRVEIGAHTDDIGTSAANLDLSTKRAQSVVDYLLKAGIASERITRNGYGEKKPLVPNTSDENRAMNRRIEFKIL